MLSWDAIPRLLGMVRRGSFCSVIIWALWARSPTLALCADPLYGHLASTYLNGTMRCSLHVSPGNGGEHLRLCGGLRMVPKTMNQPRHLLCFSEFLCLGGTDNSHFLRAQMMTG